MGPRHPSGAKLERRAIQLGLRGDILAQYGQAWIMSIEDISAFVADQRQSVNSRHYGQLITPREDLYRIDSPQVARKLGLDACSG